MMLEVLETGLLATVQDSGRFGYERFGVPVSGPMDWFALAAANRLAGNPPGAAAIECAGPGLMFPCPWDSILALAGPGFALRVNGRTHPAWMSVFVRGGSIVQVLSTGESAGFWGYLAVRGGIETPPVLGSRATYSRGGFGGLDGRALQPGDRLTVGRATVSSMDAGRWLPESYRPAYSSEALIRVTDGPQQAAFSAHGLHTFYASRFTVRETSDRMGYRLSGPAVEHCAPADILSEGLVTGAVQVAADGQPIVMMADRQTTGGYTKIAVVIRADLPLVAQCPPGGGSLGFLRVSLGEAQEAYRGLMRELQAGITDPENDQLFASRF